MQTDRDKKKASRAAAKEKKNAEKAEKEREFQAKLVGEFNDKQSKANQEKDTVAKLKQWMKNPPFKSTNKDMKKEAFYSVMQCFQSLKPEQWESLYSDGSFTVDDAVVMNKYITSGYEMLVAKDAKTAQFVSFPLLNKAQIKQVQVFGNAIILKSAFEKGGLL